MLLRDGKAKAGKELSALEETVFEEQVGCI
jgi:hypothetical protein